MKDILFTWKVFEHTFFKAGFNFVHIDMFETVPRAINVWEGIHKRWSAMRTSGVVDWAHSVVIPGQSNFI